MSTYNIGIADDHLLFAEGISNIICNKPNLKAQFIVENVPLLLQQLARQPIDLLILDINLPPDNGLQKIPWLKEQYPNMKILILSMYQPADILLDIHTFQGDAYVLKTSGKNVLEAAIVAIRQNQTFVDPNIRLHNSTLEDDFTAQLKLTKREKEIISLIAEGKSTKEIADTLYLSELTIKTHRKNISKKLGTKGVGDLVSTSMRLTK